MVIAKIANEFSRSEINGLFPISIRLSYAHQYLYPIGRDSPDHIVTDQVMQSLLSMLNTNECEEFEISLEEIVLDVFPYWGGMGTQIKKKVTKNIQRVIGAASKNDLRKYIDYRDRKMRFRIPNYRNTRSLQSFQEAGARYIRKLKKE